MRRTRVPFLAAGLAVTAALVGPAAAPAGAGTSIPVPTFTVTPSTRLVDLEWVYVAWSNQFVGITETTFYVAQCLPEGPLDPSRCNTMSRQDPAASSGSATFPVISHVGTLGLSCGTGTRTCVMELVSSSGVVRGSVPLTFASAK